MAVKAQTGTTRNDTNEIERNILYHDHNQSRSRTPIQILSRKCSQVQLISKHSVQLTLVQTLQPHVPKIRSTTMYFFDMKTSQHGAREVRETLMIW